MILIASDNHINDSTIVKHAQKGFVSKRIDAGSNALFNRYKIRKFIRQTFPNSDIQNFRTIGYSIPVVLWVTKDGIILNEKDLTNYYPFSDKLFDQKTEIIEMK